MTPTEQQNAALAAFVECVVEKLNPSLIAHTQPQNGAATYDLLIRGSGSGVLHEQLETVLRIATAHGARAFVSSRPDPTDHPDIPLCIVWPGATPSGPDPEGDYDAQAQRGRRKPRERAS